jgi:hypothetical protein
LSSVAVRTKWPSGVVERSLLKGGMAISESAKLILMAKAKGTRKNRIRNSSGGRMSSQCACRPASRP